MRQSKALSFLRISCFDYLIVTGYFSFLTFPTNQFQENYKAVGQLKLHPWWAEEIPLGVASGIAGWVSQVPPPAEARWSVMITRRFFPAYMITSQLLKHHQPWLSLIIIDGLIMIIDLQWSTVDHDEPINEHPPAMINLAWPNYSFPWWARRLACWECMFMAHLRWRREAGPATRGVEVRHGWRGNVRSDMGWWEPSLAMWP